MKNQTFLIIVSLVCALTSCTMMRPMTAVSPLSANEQMTKSATVEKSEPFNYFADLIGNEKNLQLLLEQKEIENKDMHRSKTSAAIQALGTARSMVGDSVGALEAFQSIRKLYAAEPESEQAVLTEDELNASRNIADKYQPKAALEAILRESAHRQIVILNEAHHVPRHRAFATLLALELRKQGFEYLAIETLAQDTSALLKRKYPLTGDGYYSKEPMFGDLIRQSLAVGYHPVAYEQHYDPATRAVDPEARMSAREEAQANNIIDRVLKQNPKAKIFIYVGYSHATKGLTDIGDNKKIAWMAERLRVKTGIDPLCIDQTELTEPLSGSPYQTLPDAVFVGNSEESLVLVNRTKNSDYWVGEQYKGKVDMQVIHRPVKIVNGRPDWMSMRGYRRPHTISPELLPTKGRRLIQAFVENENAGSVPMDQIVVSADNSLAPILMLPLGRYRFQYQE